MLAHFGAAFGHFGRQERGAVGKQGAQAALLLAHAGQVRHQQCGVHMGWVDQQAIQQGADPHHPLAQLAQAKHQVHRNTVGVQVGVDGVGRLAAGIQPGPKLLHGLRQVDRRATAVHLCKPGIAQGVKVGRQSMEGAGVARPRTHAQADFGRKAGSPYLAGAEGHGLQQGVLPVGQLGVGRAVGAGGRGREQFGQALQLAAGQGGQPWGVQRAGHDQGKQFRGICGFR